MKNFHADFVLQFHSKAPKPRSEGYRGTQGETFSKILAISFSAFLDCFRAFLKAYLCKLIQIGLFGVLS